MKISGLILSALALSLSATAQYQFTDLIDIERSEIKNQERTGTCWSFATSSFLESEIMRIHGEMVDLSEMYNVRKIYEDKAWNYVMRQGKANFSQGALAHDVLRCVDMHGLVPQSAYAGLPPTDDMLNHSELVASAKGFLDGVLKSGSPSIHWKSALNGILDVYMEEDLESFTFEGKDYTPESFAKKMKINPEDYRHFTSFTHHPFQDEFILEIPDNYSNGSFENLPLDEFMKVVDKALKKGFTIAWDGDVSEKGFSSKNGIAILPANPDREDLFETPGEELEVSQASRQANFEDFTTTDDHLMHVVGMAKDQDGTVYYIIKNSWGDRGPYSGYLYMSAAYFKMKTVAITLHKDAL